MTGQSMSFACCELDKRNSQTYVAAIGIEFPFAFDIVEIEAPEGIAISFWALSSCSTNLVSRTQSFDLQGVIATRFDLLFINLEENFNFT
jgi:hypothetical protein